MIPWGDGYEQWTDDTDAPPQKRPRTGKGGWHGGFSAFKVLLPDVVMANLIGNGGSTRKQLAEQTGARIRITSREELYPGTRFRTMVITADEMDKVLAVCDAVIKEIIDFGRHERDGKGKGKSTPQEETLLGKEPGEYVFRLALPAHGCTGRLIGKEGSHIKALREETGAKVSIDNETVEGHQMVRCIGTKEALAAIIPRLIEAINGELDEDRRLEWAKEVAGCNDGYKGNGKEAGGSNKGWDRNGRDKGGWRDSNETKEEYQQPPTKREVSDRYDDPPRPKYEEPERPGSDPGASLDMIADLMREFPPGSLEMAHALNCDLPANRVGNLIGRKAEFLHHVQRSTDTQIKFSEQGKGKEDIHRTLTITGPLLSVYAAHMMMMKQYHDGEERNQQQGEAETASVEEMQKKLEDLQRQLAQATGARGGKGGGKGKR